MAVMMLRFVQDNNNDIKIITHNFLENGHSMMEVDSMLAAIERETRYIDTFTTNDWKTIFVYCRRKNPYKVTIMDHKQFFFFYKLDSDKLMKNMNKDENGDTVKWLLVKLFQYRHDSSNTVLYRYGFDDHFQ